MKKNHLIKDMFRKVPDMVLSISILSSLVWITHIHNILFIKSFMNTYVTKSKYTFIYNVYG